MESKNPLIEEKLALLPNKPGVYIMKNKHDIIYVGKALILKNRVRSYFRASGQVVPKVRVMSAQIVDFEYIVTANELEALILECNLIKKYRPRYNIMLRDDKSYPYLKLTLAEEYPRLLPTRRLIKDGSLYFGPYADVGSMHKTVDFLRKVFPLRRCRKMGKRPCLEYHIKRCLAPCANLVDKESYDKMVEGTKLFLQGRSDILLKELKSGMKQASEEMRYEDAVLFRDQINSIESIRQQQTAITFTGDADVIGMAMDEHGICVQVFFVRMGKICGRDHFLMTGNENEKQSDALTAFVQQYYSKTVFISQEIICPVELEDDEKNLLSQWLSDLKGKKVEILYPKRGTKKDLLDLANQNAAILLAEENERRRKKEDNEFEALRLLSDSVGLQAPAERIDCFDISHIQGAETVASMVVFKEGVASKKDYRRYKIRSAEGKPDDFKSMKEVVLRRYQKYENLPDLVIIDGGKGQLSSALEVIRGLGLEMAVIGLAKQFEEIYLENISQPVRLEKSSPALFLIQRIRDEAHRFAITYHRKLRGKRNLVSILDNIPDVGEKRRKALWKHFASIKAIREATLDELEAVEGMNKKSAQSVKRFFELSEEGF